MKIKTITYFLYNYFISEKKEPQYTLTTTTSYRFKSAIFVHK